MDIRKQLLKVHSKDNVNKIIQYIDGNQKKFDELIELFYSGEYRLIQRAAWPLSYCAIQHPELVQKHFGRIADLLERDDLHDALRRNILRMLQFMAIPPDAEGRIMNRSFQLLENPKEAVAIKVFAMTVLSNLAKKFPDIIPELTYLIKDQLPNSTAGFKARAKKILKELGQ